MSQPLDIVHVLCTSRHAGVENYVGRLSGVLASRGHRVTVITRFPSSAFVPENVYAHDVSNWREAARTLRSLRHVDIVNSHLTEADAAAYFACRRREVPLVSTHHFASPRWSAEDGQGSAFLRFHPRTRGRRPGPVLNRIRRAVDSRVDVEVAISDFVAQRVGRCDEVVLSGVEPQPNVPALMDRPPLAVVLQRLEPIKSTIVALDAWSRSEAKSRGWTLRIHGEGSERQFLIDEIRRRGLQDSVSAPGYCREPYDLLRSASLLIAPAVGEPFGLTVAEAMSFGVPVIACASGGHLETLGRVQDAALFPENDSLACAMQIDRLTADPIRRAELSKAQSSHQVAHLSIHSMADRLEDIYRSTMTLKHRR